MASSVDDLVGMLNTPGGGQVPSWAVNPNSPWDPSAPTPENTTPGLPGFNMGAWNRAAASKWGSAPGSAAGAGGGVPGLNIPYGAEYLSPALQLYMEMLGQIGQNQRFFPGLQEQQRQFDETARQRAALSLASLYAAGPQSAAELAFANAGQGLPAVGGNAAALAGLIGPSTRGATGSTSTSPGGQTFTIPNTLSGAQLSGLTGNPNLAGVLGSFAQASGNPDIYRRSIEALIPHGYGL